jgi:hypothetical protein
MMPSCPAAVTETYREPDDQVGSMLTTTGSPPRHSLCWNRAWWRHHLSMAGLTAREMFRERVNWG